MLARRRPEVAALAIFIFIVLVTFSAHYGQLDNLRPLLRLGTGGYRTESKGGYPYVKPDPIPWHPPKPKYANSTPPSAAPERLVFVAKLQDEEQKWMSSSTRLSNWQTVIDAVDASFARLHPGSRRMDRGRVANAYLKYLIENYHNLPETMVFLNPSPTDQPSYDKMQALQDLNTDFIQSTGYANLRCIAKAGCQHQVVPMSKPPKEFRTLEVNMEKAWKGLFDNDDMPEKVGTPCCSEFAVSREQVQKRKVKEYVRYWEWLNRTIMDDDTGGMVFEYLWHIIFGKEALYCPEVETCECDLYGKC